MCGGGIGLVGGVVGLVGGVRVMGVGEVGGEEKKDKGE